MLISDLAILLKLGIMLNGVGVNQTYLSFNLPR